MASTTTRPTPAPPRAEPAFGAVIGLVAVGAALGFAELFSGLAGAAVPSPVVAVGRAVIELAPGGAIRLGIATLGESDKPALLTGITIVTLAIAALVGARSRGAWRAVSHLLLAFVAVATVAALTAPATRALPTGIVYLLAVGVGTAVAYGLGRVAAQASPPPGTPLGDPRQPPASRRAFLAWAGAGAALAGVAAAAGGRLRGTGQVEAARDAVVLPAPAVPAVAAPADLALTGLAPRLTPNADFYRIDTALLVPRVDPGSWKLRVTGLVENEVELTLEDLLAEELVETEVTLSCVSNEIGGDLVGNARWLGLPLATLLERAGPTAEASQVVGRSVDGFTAGFPLEAALDGRTALLAVGMNGEPLPVAHGFPARLVVAGLYGYVSATKWLSEIELTRWEDYDAYWIPRGWSKEGPIKTQSRIDVPRDDARVAPGPTPVAGVAWAPSRGISAVEVQVDDGPWQRAELGGAPSDNTWVQWQWTWDAPPGDHQLRVRATDGLGSTQTAERTRPVPDGASGWHTIDVEVADRA